MNTRARNDASIFPPRWRPAWALASLSMLCSGGCMEPELESYYGQHELPTVSASVNGTDVLAGMFAEGGHTVYFRRTLVTSEMESADTIVWFPNAYTAPTAEVCAWFDQWLGESPGRTLVFVGRSFDAAPLYWEQMKDRVGKDQQRAYRLREAESNLKARRPADIPTDDLGCRWFHYQPGATRKIRKLGGPWADEIDSAKTEIELSTAIVSNRPTQRLLTADSDALVARFTSPNWKDSRILLVANGSFLLNLPLVNHENRKIAGKLIAATGEPGRLVFLESDSGGPPIDPAHIDNSLWTLFGAWPLNAILLQLAVAGVIFCFSRWPIFGRPKEPPSPSTSDFSLHVAAVGQLLARTKDRQIVAQRVLHPEQTGAGVTGPATGERRLSERQSIPLESKGS